MVIQHKCAISKLERPFYFGAEVKKVFNAPTSLLFDPQDILKQISYGSICEDSVFDQAFSTYVQTEAWIADRGALSTCCGGCTDYSILDVTSSCSIDGDANPLAKLHPNGVVEIKPQIVGIDS